MLHARFLQNKHDVQHAISESWKQITPNIIDDIWSWWCRCQKICIYCFSRFELGEESSLKNVTINRLKQTLISSEILAKIKQPEMQKIFSLHFWNSSDSPGVFSRPYMWIFTLIVKKLWFLQRFSAMSHFSEHPVLTNTITTRYLKQALPWRQRIDVAMITFFAIKYTGKAVQRCVTKH